MNELPIEIQCRKWPEEIIVEPARLSVGLWGESRGDIADAYCADTLPKIKTFSHDGELFTNMGHLCGAGREAADCYPLIDSGDYRGPEPRRYSYEGYSVRFCRKAYRLGPRVRFVCRERAVEEWVNLLRLQYAYGGCFASGKTYLEVLRFFAGRSSVSANAQAAIEMEATSADLPVTQEEMRASFAQKITPRLSAQLELSLGSDQ